MVSGAPSTAHALATRRDPFASVRAAAALTGLDDAGWPAAALGGAVAHGAVSAFWAAVLAQVLPPGRRAAWGAAAGAAIYVLDLQLIARHPRLASMRRLPALPQLADHIAFAATTGFLLDHLDAHRPNPRSGQPHEP